jgi:P-type Ca2+ transporter type 2C
MTVAEILDRLSTGREGLSSSEAASRLAAYGPNALREKGKRTPFVMFLDQFKDFMIIVLIISAIVSGVIGDAVDTVAIIVIVLLNAVVGFVQEYRAERAMAALKKMASPTAEVMRDGGPLMIPASGLVPGDIVVLEDGRIIPADLRLLETVRMKVEEAALTGESLPSDKLETALPDEHLPLGDRRNMAYKGTFVSYGRGSGVVVATGMETELGRIATMLQEQEEGKTPLQKRLAAFGRRLAIAFLIICSIVFVMGAMRGEEPLLMLLTAISLAVAAIPEALPAVVTISLALGARKMVGQNALIRKLPAVETLGSVTYICSDKTGTLTLNKMTVEEIYAGGASHGSEGYDSALTPVLIALYEGMALSNDVRPDADGNVIGDPTETALCLAAEQAGFRKADLEKADPRVAEIPFDSGRKCMTTVHRDAAGRIRSFTKGAAEEILIRSVSSLGPDGAVTAKGWRQKGRGSSHWA